MSVGPEVGPLYLSRFLPAHIAASLALPSYLLMKKAISSDTKDQKRNPRTLRATRNRRLAAQTRKILGKHYANKYRVRSRRHES